MKTNDLIGPALDWAVSVAELDTEDGLPPQPYSTDWAQGGLIIEREGIALQRWLDYGWLADTWNFKFATGHSQGPTPLIAAMRYYVASKLGFEIDIPEELNP